MTIRHHPRDETLARFAAGTLEAGPAIVVATHLTGCRRCNERVAEFEAIGGALLEELPPAPLVPEALALILGKIDACEPTPTPMFRQRRQSPPLPGGVVLPAPLRACDIGHWRWLAPGMHRARVELPGNPKAGVELFRIKSNRKLSIHGHTGTEFTQVISGSFSDEHSRYFPGDLVEADCEVDHQPMVGSDGPCICLIAMQGHMRLRGFIGHLLQPFVGR